MLSVVHTNRHSRPTGRPWQGGAKERRSGLAEEKDLFYQMAEVDRGGHLSGQETRKEHLHHREAEQVVLEQRAAAEETRRSPAAAVFCAQE